MWFRAVTSFVVVFVLAFFLGGWFLMPYLPPVPDYPVSVFEIEYWTTNWAGALLGVFLGGLSAFEAISKARRQQRAELMSATSGAESGDLNFLK